MKKVILSIMAVAAISFSSCGNKTENGGDADSTTNEMEVNVLPDWTVAEQAVKSLDASLEIGTPEDVEDCVERMEVQVTKLIEQGKLDEAKAYAEKIQNFVKENKEKLAATGSALVSSFVSSTEKLDLNNLETSAQDLLSTVKAAAGESGARALSDVEGAAKEAAQAVAGDAAGKVEAAKSKVDEVKSKVDNAPETAKKAVEDAKNKAKEDLKNKANEEVNKGLNKLLGK